VNRYWVRVKLYGTDDYRSLTFPPIGILGYWCTGYSGEYTVLCCVIEVSAFEDISRIVNENFVGSPTERADIDFADKKPNNWVPSGDRFPLENWMETLRKDSKDVSVDGETG
jgi:hypothetical protein